MKIKGKGVLFLLFLWSIIITLLVTLCDVRAIGPLESKVGLSTLNAYIHCHFPYNEFWYVLTQIIGLLALVLCAFLGLVGIRQLMKRKSLKKVDFGIRTLGIFYIIVILLYVLFEVVVINYRPIIMPNATELEASFPSSHTLLVVFVMGSALFIIDRYIYKRKLNLILRVICYCLILLMIVGRLLSGVHWGSDIVAGVIYGSTLLEIYKLVLNKHDQEKKKSF